MKTRIERGIEGKKTEFPLWFPLFVFSGLGLDLEVLLNRTVNISLLLPSPNSMEVINSFLVGDKGCGWELE